MTRNAFRRLCPALLLVALLGTTHLDAGGPNGKARPFKGNAEGLVTGFQEDGALVIESVENATHLGRFTKAELLYTDNFPAIYGSATFTAANGDQLFTTFQGGFTSPTTAEGVYTITGGTGRFVGATGAASFGAQAENLGSVITLKFDGTINY